MQRWISPKVPGLIVSIHDVHPGNAELVSRILADLKRVGVSEVSLLVVPFWHREVPSFSDAKFCEWMRERQREGHELVLHGYFHLRVSQVDARGWAGLVSKVYTNGEGEFYDSDEEESRELLEKGCNEMGAFLAQPESVRTTSQPPAGFIAPAWLLGEGARSALRHFPFEYTTVLRGVWDFRHPDAEQNHSDLPGHGYTSMSLCYSVRAAWRRACSLAWNTLLLQRLAKLPLVRISLHPPDWQYSSIRNHALQSIERALAGRPAMTYENWIQKQRDQHKQTEP